MAQGRLVGAGFRGGNVKTIFSRLPVILPAASAVIAASGGSRQYVPFVKSVCVGAVYLFRKVFSADFRSILTRFYSSVSDESVVAMIAEHFKVVRVLNYCGARALTARFPNYGNKYVVPYLARRFDKKTRREILKFHHEYLAACLIDSFYEEVLERRPTLWNEVIDGANYTIALSFNQNWHSEGDLSLTFERNDTTLYELSFTIVPGYSTGSGAKRVLLVGRVQGLKGQSDEIRAGTKACHDIAPANLLVAAAQTIAGVLGVDGFGGVSNQEQLAKSVYDVSGFYFDYDAFWASFPVEKSTANIFLIPVPFPERPFGQVSAAHRRRTRNKRRQRKKIADCVAATFAKNFLKEQTR